MATDEAFNRAVDHVLKEEGGYVNDPNDKGGETKFGISKKSYPNEDIAKLTLGRAKELYYKDFWAMTPTDSVDDATAFILFDIAVNCGVRRAKILLQRACGVTADGIIGKQTLAAIENTKDLCERLTFERIKYYQSLPDYKHFGNGWMLRSLRVLREA